MRLLFDLDGFDDPAPGDQQLTLFDGYRKQNQYFPLIINNAEAGLVVMIALRNGTAYAVLGADDDLAIEVRGDKWFGVPRGVHLRHRHESPPQTQKPRPIGGGEGRVRTNGREAAAL